MTSSLATALLLAVSSGCSDTNAAVPPSTTDDPTPRTPDPGCVAPSGVSNSPGTVAEAVSLINALPKPLSLPCFLQSLARPLPLYATNSLFSAQPANGPRSPRIFLSEGSMLMSVVPEGTGAALLEFGEQRPDFRSLKAELTFPIQGPVAASAPFDGVMYNDQMTTCAGCHAAEATDASVSPLRAFVSQSLRPATADRVSLASLQNENAICDPKAEAARCAMLDGLLGWGSVTDFDFPFGMSTFGGAQ